MCSLAIRFFKNYKNSVKKIATYYSIFIDFLLIYFFLLVLHFSYQRYIKKTQCRIARDLLVKIALTQSDYINKYILSNLYSAVALS